MSRKASQSGARFLLIAMLVAMLSGCGTPDSPEATVAATNEGSPAVSSDKSSEASAALEAKQSPDDDRLLDKTFDDIMFDIEPDAPFDRSLLTDAVRELDGRRMRIRGYILPSAQKRLTQFVLVRDNQECCFGPGAALYDCVLVEMQPGVTADYSIRPVAVEGRFRVEEFLNPLNPDGPPLAIYQMEGEAVR